MNPNFTSYSQAGQDAFVHALIGDSGTFLDIGASEPIKWSNTYGLEQVGWTGICVEFEEELCRKLRQQRTATIIQANATIFPWFKTTPSLACDYLSLDIDEGTLGALGNLPLDHFKFRVITIEHDAYRHGEALRKPEREILTAAGYVLVRPDVANAHTPDMPFEDWWTCPELAEKARGLP